MRVSNSRGSFNQVEQVRSIRCAVATMAPTPNFSACDDLEPQEWLGFSVSNGFWNPSGRRHCLHVAHVRSTRWMSFVADLMLLRAFGRPQGQQHLFANASTCRTRIHRHRHLSDHTALTLMVSLGPLTTRPSAAAAENLVWRRPCRLLNPRSAAFAGATGFTGSWFLRVLTASANQRSRGSGTQRLEMVSWPATGSALSRSALHTLRLMPAARVPDLQTLGLLVAGSRQSPGHRDHGPRVLVGRRAAGSSEQASCRDGACGRHTSFTDRSPPPRRYMTWMRSPSLDDQAEIVDTRSIDGRIPLPSL